MNPLRRLRHRTARILDRRIEDVVAHVDRRQAVFCGGHEVLTRTPSGQPIYVDMRDVSVASHLALGEPYERGVTSTLAALARPTDTFLDVGANFGYHTVMLAPRLVGERAFVCFEPNPVVRRTLRRTLHANGLAPRTSLEEVALSDREGTATLSVWSDLWGGASLGRPEDAVAARRPWLGMTEVEESHTVPTTTLDRWADAHDLPALDLAKIDVEGHEDAVFTGMTALLDRSPDARVVLEFTFDAYADAEGFWARLGDAFPHRGAIDDDGRIVLVRTLGDLRAAATHELVNVVLSRPPLPA